MKMEMEKFPFLVEIFCTLRVSCFDSVEFFFIEMVDLSISFHFEIDTNSKQTEIQKLQYYFKVKEMCGQSTDNANYAH